MRLLVSVADAGDARAALAGGADIIDAKDPTLGALGAVTPDALLAIHAVAHARRPVSAALGDARDERGVERSARAAAAVGLAFVKVGFRQVASVRRARALAAAAVCGAREADAGTGVIVVAYADARRAESVPPAAMPEIAARAGAVGVLLDTAFKDHGGLFAHLGADAVGAWVSAAHAVALLAALAGALDGAGIDAACALGADIAGVRGAACVGGRSGRVSVERVRVLAALAYGHAGFSATQQRPQARDVARGEHHRLYPAR